jgi:predicted alpha/beta hydrolase
VGISNAENPGSSESSDGRQVRLPALDGYELGGVFYDALRPRSPRRVAVLHGGAGIPAFRYRRFARFLAEWGIPVLTYDYRGIGMSRPDELRAFQATTADWVEYDGAAAIAWMRERYPDDELIGISHSIGALALGAAPNAAEQDRLVLIAPHTAYYGDYRPLYRLPMAMMWHGLMPVITRFIGYFPARRLGLGDDLPAGIALEWADRRSAELRPTGAGIADDRIRRLIDYGSALRRPALAITMSDDAFATIAGAKRLLSYFPRLSSPQHVVFTPADAHARRIGHFGFFRRDVGPALWPRLLALLKGRPLRHSQDAAATGSL